MLSKRNRKYRESAAALVELAITFPIALTIALCSIHLSDVMRESSVILEAARHGARAVSAASGMPDTSGHLPAWANSKSYQSFTKCKMTASSPATAHQIANIAACDFMQTYLQGKWKEQDWEVKSDIDTSSTEGVTFWYISVSLKPVNSRGPVSSLVSFFNLQPQSTAIFPLMRVGA